MKKIFENKKIFLTGHTGFKGAWLLSILHHFGAKVSGYALAPNTEPNLYSLIEGERLCKSIIADIRDVKTLHTAMQEADPDFVFHLAAQPLVRTSYEIPAETFEVNAIGTANVLDGIRALKKACIGVMITTDKVYQNKESGQAYKEEDRFGGYDPYSASKACAELVIDSYRNSFFNPKDYEKHQKSIASARAGNVIGGGDWAKDRLIPDIVRSLEKNETILLRNPLSVRPWQHVLEPLEAYLTLAAAMTMNPVEYATAFNFGPNPQDVLTVEQMAIKSIEVWGKGSMQVAQNKNQLHEAGLLSLDIAKAKKKLNWEPRWSAEQAVEKALYWYRNYQGNSAYSLCIEQFSEYMQK